MSLKSLDDCWRDSLLISRGELETILHRERVKDERDDEQDSYYQGIAPGQLVFGEDTITSELDFLDKVPTDVGFERFFYHKFPGRGPRASVTKDNNCAGAGFILKDRRGQLPPAAAALLASQCRSDEDVTRPRRLSVLLQAFMSPTWSRPFRPLRRWPFPYYNLPLHFHRHEPPITLQFLFRYVSVVESREEQGPGYQAAVRIPQLKHQIGVQRLAYIQERRHLLVMRFFPGVAGSRFTLISLGRLPHNRDHDSYVSEHDDSGAFSPLTLYIRYLRSLLLVWSDEWLEVLKNVDDAISYPISDIEDDDKLKPLMLDGDDGRTAKVYFKLFHLLRGFEGIISEMQNDFRDWKFKVIHTLEKTLDHEKESSKAASHQGRIDNLEKAIKAWKNRGNALDGRISESLGRVRQKREEISSLGDSMFNATAIEEARKSTRLNQYVLIFTVVTIVYLPLSFVTGFFGMNNIANDSILSGSFRPFGWMLLSITLSTYAACILGYALWHYNIGVSDLKITRDKNKSTSVDGPSRESSAPLSDVTCEP